MQRMKHDCEKPNDTEPGKARMWTCPTCGQRWMATTQYINGTRSEGWTRALLPGIGINANLHDAYDMEQVANALPKLAVLKKASLRRQARVLRRLEGQRDA